MYLISQIRYKYNQLISIFKPHGREIALFLLTLSAFRAKRIMDTQDLQKIKNKYDIIGNDAMLNRAIETAVAVAPTDLTVLITGESGTGKENIPRIIHQHSRRKNGKFLAVNCGGIPEGTINSELFGHEKGSFTGATETRKGYFEEANGGTLFLDEVGELPPSTQAMLLRVLQNGEFIKVGSSKVEKTDVRVVAATNVNLIHAVRRGRFREDLYYRLNAIQITMPALRDRKDDIYLLFRKFAADFSEKYSVCRVALSHEAISMLQSYRWPGNIRQLKNVTESVCAMESMKLSPNAERCEVSAAALASYIPKETPDNIPVISDGRGQGSGISDSDMQMIIKAILDLKQDIDKLNAAVFGDGGPRQIAAGHIPAPAPAVAKHAAAMEEPEWQESEPEQQETAEQHEESLSLQKVEHDNILKALEKYKGNRKLAAAELGISERTLYRRLSSKD